MPQAKRRDQACKEASVLKEPSRRDHSQLKELVYSTLRLSKPNHNWRHRHRSFNMVNVLTKYIFEHTFLWSYQSDDFRVSIWIVWMHCQQAQFSLNFLCTLIDLFCENLQLQKHYPEHRHRIITHPSPATARLDRDGQSWLDVLLFCLLQWFNLQVIVLFIDVAFITS